MRGSDGNGAVTVGSDDGRGTGQGRCLLLGEKLRQERLGTGTGHGIIFLIFYLFSKDLCKSEQPLFVVLSIDLGNTQMPPKERALRVPVSPLISAHIRAPRVD